MLALWNPTQTATLREAAGRSAISHFSTLMLGQGMKREKEREKVRRYKVLCNQRGLTFARIIFTTSGGMEEAFQRQIWHPHWKRVEAEDAEMKISEWVSRKGS